VCDVVQGLQWILHLATPVDSLLALHVPAYPPFLDTSSTMSRPILPIPAERTASGWAFDHDRFAADLAAARGRCRALLLCNPQNPTGHVFTGGELARLAALAEEHDLIVISDEIHADLVYPPATHVPIAALDPVIAARTVTLTSATKAFNIAGVRCAVAHLGSKAVRQAWEAQPQHLFGVVAHWARCDAAAWEDGGDWLDALLVHLDRNRRLLGSLLAAQLPDVGYVPPEATYLAWLDMLALQLAVPPHTVLRDGGAVLSPGPDFGPEGEGFVRLNFATSAAMLEALVARWPAPSRPRRADATRPTTRRAVRRDAGAAPVTLRPGTRSAAWTARVAGTPRRAGSAVGLDRAVQRAADGDGVGRGAGAGDVELGEGLRLGLGGRGDGVDERPVGQSSRHPDQEVDRAGSARARRVRGCVELGGRRRPRGPAQADGGQDLRAVRLGPARPPDVDSGEEADPSPSRPEAGSSPRWRGRRWS
jgi:cystathionine beta-lyase